MNEIILKPIGIVHSPYTEAKDIPIQGKFKENVEAIIELEKEYEDGLTDLDQFSYAIIIYHFHKAKKVSIKSKPFLEDTEHGIFAIRSPFRPNNIGISIVKIERIIKNKLFFTEVDVFDGTPIIDIKPYVKHFDNRENAKAGWLDKHFLKGNIPEKTILK